MNIAPRLLLSGLDIVNFNGVPIGTDDYRGNKEVQHAYADLGTWWCITPFISMASAA